MTERSINPRRRAVASLGLIFALGLLAVILLAGVDDPSARQEEAASSTTTTSATAATSTTTPATTESTAAPTETTAPAPAAPAGDPRPSSPPRPRREAPPTSAAVSPAASPLAAAWRAAGARNVAPDGPPAASPGGGGPAPVRIDIPAIGVSAPVDPLGLNADGTMQVPQDFSRTGYYTGRPVPGDLGPAVIVGHVDSRRGPAVFYRLRRLGPGAEVVVHRTDGSAVAFVVERSKQVPKSEFPTDEVYGPTPGPTLRLITCGGSFDRSTRHYRDNTIVFLRMKG